MSLRDKLIQCVGKRCVVYRSGDTVTLSSEDYYEPAMVNVDDLDDLIDVLEDMRKDILYGH